MTGGFLVQIPDHVDLTYQGQEEEEAHSDHVESLKFQILPVLLPSSHALLIYRALKFPMARENDLTVDDDSLDDFVHMGLTGHRVLAVRDGHQSGAKADGQVVGIHHILITVLRQTEGGGVREQIHAER